MAVAIHLCRGNLKGAWMAEGGYEPIAEALFNKLDVGIYCLEYDTERAGDFAPLRFVPKGKRVILGLVSTKTPQLEIERRAEAQDRRRLQSIFRSNSSASARNAASRAAAAAARR